MTPPDHVFQSRERTLLHQITHLAEKYHLPDIDVVLVTDDFCPNLEWQPRSLKNTFDRCHELVRVFFGKSPLPSSPVSSYELLSDTDVFSLRSSKTLSRVHYL